MRLERSTHGPFERLSLTVDTPFGVSQHSLYRLGDTLIDTGAAVARALVLAVLRERPPRRIVCTHQHEDHVGNVAAIRREFGALPVHVPRAHVGIVTTQDRVPEYRALFWGHPEPTGPVEPYDPGAVFEDSGVALAAWETPGHTPHHVAFVARAGADVFALTGDLYTSRPLAAWYESAADDMAESLRRLADLGDALVVLPTHGRVKPDGARVLSHMADWLDRESDEVRAIARRLGTTDPRAVAAARYADLADDLHDRVSCGEISRAGFVRSVLDPVRRLPAVVP
jgi:glyoxylase-like metal-dependent hydrolase (beta-lactamase superfamily II)